MCETTKNYRTATITVRYEASDEAGALETLVSLVNGLEEMGEDINVTDTTLNKKNSINGQTIYYNTQGNGITLR